MLSVYPAVFIKDKNDVYSVIFPDLNYLSTCGKGLEEAMTMALDCLAGYLFICRQDGDEIPSPSDMSEIDLDSIVKQVDLEGESQSSFINLISVDVENYAREHFEKSVRKSLTIPAWLNKAAMDQGINFSQVLQEALVSKLQIKKLSL